MFSCVISRYPVYMKVRSGANASGLTFGTAMVTALALFVAEAAAVSRALRYPL
jgi:hypothetical protein